MSASNSPAAGSSAQPADLSPIAVSPKASSIPTASTTLYHYTSPAGFLGIIQNKQLWATETPHLNDTDEIRYGMKRLIRALREKADSLPPPSAAEVEECCVSQHLPSGEPNPDRVFPLADGLRAVATWLENHHTVPLELASSAPFPYVVCLTECRDDLGQWRGYGRGSGGGGFAIGFDPAALNPLTYQLTNTRDRTSGDIWQDWELAPPQPVRYGKRKRDRHLSDLVDFLVSDKQTLLDHGPTVHLVKFTMNYLTVCLRLLSMYKRRSFRAEREWRIVASTPGFWPNIKFRPGGPAGITPYVEIKFPTNAVQEVIIGPSDNQRTRRHMVNQVLDSCGYSNVTVRTSSIPYRE